MASQQFCLKWNNHTNNMLNVFDNLLSTEALVDVTLACDGLSLKAHKMVLSACSPFFQSLFLENPCKHPIVIMKDMNYKDLKAIVDFMYRGEVNVSQDQLSALLKTAETLKVKGLAEVSGENRQASGVVQQEISTPQQPNSTAPIPTSSSTPQQQPPQPQQRRADSPPIHGKRKRGRPRKRSLSDSNRSDDEMVPTKIKEPDSPEIEELSGGDASMDASGGDRQGSNSSQGPMHSSVNSFSSKHPHSNAQVEEPPSGEENEFEVEPSKLLEQTLTTDNVPPMSNAASSSTISSGNFNLPSSSGLEISQISMSGDNQALVPVSGTSDSLSSSHLQGPDSPQDIKPAILTFEEPPISPVAGTSQSMVYMDQSSLPGPSNYQDNSLIQHDAQPQVENSDPVVASDSSCGASCSSSVEETYAVERKHPRTIISDDSDWLDAFRIPYENFPKAVLAACERGQRPSPPERREIIRIICTAVYEKTSVPLKKHMAVIAQQLVKKFPLSFLDIVNGDVIGNGYASVMNQLVARAENVRRCSPPTKRKKIPKSTPTKVVPVGDSYGCLQLLSEVHTDVAAMMTASDSSCGASCSSPPDETSILDSVFSSSLHTVSSDWISSFEIPYNSFPRTVLAACERGDRPTPAERREIIRIICSAIFEKTNQPLKKHMAVIAQNLVKRYPQSFQDVLNGDVIGNGYSSVMNQLIARAENVRRSMRNSMKRRMSALSGMPITKLPLSDSYGCVEFLPEFPTGEDEASQVEKKLLLQEEFLAVEWDKQKVNLLMQLTYASQRLTIINRKDISEVKREWPFLTVSEFLLNHFEKLIGFQILDRLDLAVEKKAPELLAFFKSPHNPHSRKFVDVEPAANLFGFISWLCNYFDENENQLFKVYENSNCIEDVEADESCPLTPFIATFGNSFDMEPCCLVFVEREVISEFVNIRKALVIWFAAFYIFNLKYPEACSATLEFIQRAFFNINSERGTKMPKRIGKRTNIHPKVLALSNNLSQYKNWRNFL